MATKCAISDPKKEPKRRSKPIHKNIVINGVDWVPIVDKLDLSPEPEVIAPVMPDMACTLREGIVAAIANPVRLEVMAAMVSTAEDGVRMNRWEVISPDKMAVVIQGLVCAPELISAWNAVQEIGAAAGWFADLIAKRQDEAEDAVVRGAVPTYNYRTGKRFQRDEQTRGLIVTTRKDIEVWVAQEYVGAMAVTSVSASAEKLDVSATGGFDFEGYPKYAPSDKRPAGEHLLMIPIWLARAKSGNANKPAEVYAHLKRLAKSQPQLNYLVFIDEIGELKYFSAKGKAPFTCKSLQKVLHANKWEN